MEVQIEEESSIFKKKNVNNRLKQEIYIFLSSCAPQTLSKKKQKKKEKDHFCITTRMGRLKKKGEEGNAVKYITRSSAVRRLQVSFIVGFVFPLVFSSSFFIKDLSQGL